MLIGWCFPIVGFFHWGQTHYPRASRKGETNCRVSKEGKTMPSGSATELGMIVLGTPLLACDQLLLPPCRHAFRSSANSPCSEPGFESCGLQGFVGSGDAGLLLRAARSLLLLQRQVIDRSLMSASVGRMLFQQRDEAVRFEAERECPGRKESALRS